MCIKHVAGRSFADSDMDLATFSRLKPLLPTAESIILNGIGEPLMNTELVEMIAFARKHLPSKATIGFQSNGHLLDSNKLKIMVDAGLNEICLSLDTLDRSRVGVHGGHGIDRLEKGFAAVVGARQGDSDSRFRFGVEVVIDCDNLAELPAILAWARKFDIDFAVFSHLAPYGAEQESRSLFNPNSTNAQEIFRRGVLQAQRQGWDLRQTFLNLRKKGRLSLNTGPARLLKDMIDEARAQNIWFNLQHLFDWQDRQLPSIDDAFSACREFAEKEGFELVLPAVCGTDLPSCRFIKENSMFVSAAGQVSPCHLVWHDKNSWLNGEALRINTRSFGSILERSPLDIWHDSNYLAFRNEASTDGFPSCNSCAMSPCPDITGSAYDFITDCYGNTMPCGFCLWGQQALHCL